MVLESQAREYFKQDSTNAQNLGVLVSALDLRPSIGTDKESVYHIYNAEYMPFVLLGAVVLP